jgi:hypothetical protein
LMISVTELTKVRRNKSQIVAMKMGK